mgnify:CR=1 FL=1
MSIQSDVEMMSIRALENYAKTHHLSESVAVDLFHKHQINICIQIRDVIDIIKETTGMNFPDATVAFYHSKTYKALQNTENTLWAESAGYIADRYFKEQKEKSCV